MAYIGKVHGDGPDKLVVELGGTLALDAGSVAPVVRVAKVALGVADTPGGVLAWANPESGAIAVTRVLLDVTTKSTGACTLDVGVAANGTTSADNLIDGVDVAAAAGLFGNLGNAGTNGKTSQRMAAGTFLTASKASGAAAGIIGSAYVTYVVL